MNWQNIERLLKDCAKAPAADSIPEAIPPGYAAFLTRFNGAEGFVGPEQYLMLWQAEQVEELNAAYSTAQYLPGAVLIGTDGGGTGFGIHRGRYVSVPLIGMSPAETKDLGASFEEFLERLASPE